MTVSLEAKREPEAESRLHLPTSGQHWHSGLSSLSTTPTFISVTIDGTEKQLSTTSEHGASMGAKSATKRSGGGETTTTGRPPDVCPCSVLLFWLGSTSSADTVGGSAKQARRTNMRRNVLTDAALPEGVRAPQISRPAVGHRCGTCQDFTLILTTKVD